MHRWNLTQLPDILLDFVWVNLYWKCCCKVSTAHWSFSRSTRKARCKKPSRRQESNLKNSYHWGKGSELEQAPLMSSCRTDISWRQGSILFRFSRPSKMAGFSKCWIVIIWWIKEMFTSTHSFQGYSCMRLMLLKPKHCHMKTTHNAVLSFLCLPWLGSADCGLKLIQRDADLENSSRALSRKFLTPGSGTLSHQHSQPPRLSHNEALNRDFGV